MMPFPLIYMTPEDLHVALVSRSTVGVGVPVDLPYIGLGTNEAKPAVFRLNLRWRR